LTAFVREFGPVVPSRVSVHEPSDAEERPWYEDQDWRSTIYATQTLPTLRSEQRTYAAALRLMTEVKRGRDKSDGKVMQRYISEIEEGVRSWPEQYKTELAWRNRQYFGAPAWYFNEETYRHLQRCRFNIEWRVKYESIPPPDRHAFSDSDTYEKAAGVHRLSSIINPEAHYVGHSTLCELINAFRTEVQHYSDHPTEALSLFSLRFGIRPSLYFILRHEYLGRGGTFICGNDRCGEFFVSERAGQRYCSADCSSQYRQREYWTRSGARKRKRRRAKARSEAKSVHTRGISPSHKADPKSRPLLGIGSLLPG
jgi:hypothetical protein